MINLVAIDPGISGTGIAFFQGRELIEAYNMYSKAVTWEERALDITDQIDNAIDDSCHPILIEFPEPMKGSAKTIASRDKGDTLKLACFVGMVMGRLGMDIDLVKPSRWKGQLSKQVVQQRVGEWLEGTNYIGIDEIVSHSWDAIGIGLWYMGKF